MTQIKRSYLTDVPKTPVRNPYAPWRLLLQVGLNPPRPLLFDMRSCLRVGRIDDTSASKDGRPNADIDLNRYGAAQRGVSRLHLEFRFDPEEGRLNVVDLGSTNGTRLNGLELTPQQEYRVRNGDELELGSLPITVKLVKLNS